MAGKKKGIGDMISDLLGDDDDAELTEVSGQKGGSTQQSSDQGSGWHDDAEEHSEAGKKAAETAEERYGEDFHENIGAKGGESAQERGTAHELTDEERSKGGKA